LIECPLERTARCVIRATKKYKLEKIMSQLKAVKPKQAELGKPKILIFGKPGVGKTWGCLEFPAAYYIDTESAANLPHYLDRLHESGGSYLGREQGSQVFQEVINQIKALATEQHGYKTLIIDSLSKLFNVVIAKEAERLGDKDVFGASKKLAINYVRQLINWIDRLDMNVIIICQEKSEWSNDKQVGVTFDAWEKLEYELHLCLHIVRAGSSLPMAFIRKSRLKEFKQSENFSWSYNEFSKRYGEALITSDVKAFELITTEQLDELYTLIDVLNIDAERVGKWLDYDKAESLKELSGEYATKLIAKIKGDLPK
jgi:hypothetical protein